MAIKALQLGQHYHIYNRGNNSENLFKQERNYLHFMKLYTKHILPLAETFAYCLLPNHFHFAIRTRTAEEQAHYWATMIQPYTGKGKQFKHRAPSEGFKNLFIAYTKSINKAFDRTGALFEKPFRRKPVDSEAYLLTLIVYIHQNPQTHGLVNDFCDWKWSSFNAFLSKQPTKIKRDEVLEWFGDRNVFHSAHGDEADTKLIESLLLD